MQRHVCYRQSGMLTPSRRRSHSCDALPCWDSFLSTVQHASAALPAPHAVTLVNAHPGLQAGCPLQCQVSGLHAVDAGTPGSAVCAFVRAEETYYGASPPQIECRPNSQRHIVASQLLGMVPASFFAFCHQLQMFL